MDSPPSGLVVREPRDPFDALVCDAGGAAARLETVEALARLQLAERRRGRRLRVAGASAELRALVTLVGLHEALGLE